MTTMSPKPLQIDLKETTHELHELAEHGAFNKQLMLGHLPLSAYVDSLGQLYLVHRALELEIRRAQSAVPALATIVRDYQFQEPYLLADLTHFGRDPKSIEPMPPTAKFIEHIHELAGSRPIGLLGVHYVFEGSNNGSKYIANALRRAYRLEGISGLKYFDPYGDHQREHWRTFKEDMARVEFSLEDRRVIVHTACETFRAVIALHESLHAALLERHATS